MDENTVAALCCKMSDATDVKIACTSCECGVDFQPVRMCKEDDVQKAVIWCTTSSNSESQVSEIMPASVTQASGSGIV